MRHLRATALLGLITLAAAAFVPGQAQEPTPAFNRVTPAVLAVQRVGPAVVNINTQSVVDTRHLWGGLFQSRTESDPQTGETLADRSLGSGFLIHPSGYLLTNEHVVNGADRIKVTLSGGRTLDAKVVNASMDADLALLKIEEDGPFPVVSLADSDQLMVGEPTIALGNPFGLTNSVTTGILSAVGRTVSFRGRTVYKDFLQTSALINPGNSGGPLLDVNGRVIGINVAIDTRGQGISYAIPINRAKEVLDSLVNPELARQASLGFESGPREGRVVVVEVVPEGPAARAGLLAQDAIIAVDGHVIRTVFDLNAAVLEHDPGQQVQIAYERSGRRGSCRVLFEALPLISLASEKVALHGMTCANLTEALGNKLAIPSGAPGVVVVSLEAGTPADRLGLQEGDLIYQVEHLTIPNIDGLARVLTRLERAGSARLLVWRKGARLEGRLLF